MSSRSVSSRRSPLVVCVDATESIDLPSLPSTDLRHALNAQKRAPSNNDVLEFIGDRVVNLTCALLASRINYSPAQKTLVARCLSNNDTLGRLAYQLRLHHHVQTRLDPSDQKVARNWAPLSNSGSPPKLFADLFEAYTGAVYVRHGWHYTHAWLRQVYAPVYAATSKKVLLSTEVAPLRWLAAAARPWTSRTQRAFESFMYKSLVDMRNSLHNITDTFFKGDMTNGKEEKVEIGTQVLKLWICDTALGIYPELHKAMERGASLLTSVTCALMSDDSLGLVGLILSLSFYLPQSDPDFLITYEPQILARKPSKNDVTNPDKVLIPQLDQEPKDRQTLTDVIRAKPKLANVLKGLVGAFYLRHPTRSRRWGHEWLKPLVSWAIDALLYDRGRCRPIIDKDAQIPVVSQPKDGNTERSGHAAETEPKINSLLLAFEDLVIAPLPSTHGLSTESKASTCSNLNDVDKDKIIPSTAKPLPTFASDTETKSTKSKPSEKTAKYMIKIKTTFISRNAAVDLPQDLEVDPYKLLKEAGPTAFPNISSTKDVHPDTTPDMKLHQRKAETKSTPDDQAGAGHSGPGSEDMEFSSSSTSSGVTEDSGSDMEFSSSSSSEDERCKEPSMAATSGAGSDTLVGLLQALERLELGAHAGLAGSRSNCAGSGSGSEMEFSTDDENQLSVNRTLHHLDAASPSPSIAKLVSFP